MIRPTDLGDSAPSDEEPAAVPPDRPTEDSLSPHPGRPMSWPPTEHQRGLASPYPPGGGDPQPDAGRREERFYLRLLIAMVLIIVVGGFAVSIIGILLGFAGGE